MTCERDFGLNADSFFSGDLGNDLTVWDGDDALLTGGDIIVEDLDATLGEGLDTCGGDESVRGDVGIVAAFVSTEGPTSF